MINILNDGSHKKGEGKWSLLDIMDLAKYAPSIMINKNMCRRYEQYPHYPSPVVFLGRLLY